MSLQKPVMRSLYYTYIRKHIILSMICGGVTGLSYYNFVVIPKHKKYEEYNANYDADAEFKRMNDLGLFQGLRIDE